jgi:RNA polymerase sigma-70 factor, ECF subfamily
MIAAMHQDHPSSAVEAAVDADLLRRCAAGEAEALRLLFDRHGGAMGQYLYRLLGSREDAEEVVVDVFMRAWRSAAGFRGSAPAHHWLYRIAYRLAIDRLRARPRLPGAVLPFSELDAESVASMTGEPEATFFSAYQRERDQGALRHALAELAPHDRTLLALHYLEECSYEEIRAITGGTLAGLKSRLHRARQRLKRRFLIYRDTDEAVETLDSKPDKQAWDPRQLRSLYRARSRPGGRDGRRAH